MRVRYTSFYPMVSSFIIFKIRKKINVLYKIFVPNLIKQRRPWKKLHMNSLSSFFLVPFFIFFIFYSLFAQIFLYLNTVNFYDFLTKKQYNKCVFSTQIILAFLAEPFFELIIDISPKEKPERKIFTNLALLPIYFSNKKDKSVTVFLSF